MRLDELLAQRHHVYAFQETDVNEAEGSGLCAKASLAGFTFIFGPTTNLSLDGTSRFGRRPFSYALICRAAAENNYGGATLST